jgi:signal transduction histidine kinase/CheY-like chemotaxis protein
MSSPLRPWMAIPTARMSVWEALAYGLVAAAMALLLVLIHLEKSTAHEEALKNYRGNASLRTREAATQLEAKFRQIYQGIRTLARLPGTRSIDRYARNFDENARSSAQEIYNNLAESVAISETYIIPAEFDPDAIDPNTGRHQEPITTFDELIVGRTADTAGGGLSAASVAHAHRSLKVEEIEIHEYRLMREQLSILKARFPKEAEVARLAYPAIAGPEVITCDNTRYSPSKPNDKDRAGLVYSVPFYGLDGTLRGIVSAVILTSAVRDMVPIESAILYNDRYKYSTGRSPEDRDQVEKARSAVARSNLFYSETVDLDITDLTGGWMLWAGLDDGLFWSSAGAVSASAKAATQQIMVAVSAIILWIIIYTVGQRHREAQTRRRELEACIVERTRDLADATDAANSANQAKTRFLSVMSHEIRTPMSSIVGMADLLAHSTLQRQQGHYLQVIQSSADALLNIINDVLDLAKIEAGKIELHPGPFALDQILADVVGMFAEQARDKGLVLDHEVHGDVPATLWVDGVRLRQVLTNLIGNAVKFTDAGKIHISVTAGASRHGRTEIQFAVSDTGMGIAPDAGSTIFEPFRQGHNGASVPLGGTGLGLSISHMLVEMMGGKLRYESVLNLGTTFYFNIEVEAAAAPGCLDAMRGDEEAAKRGFPGMSVLVAEDNPVSQEVTRAYLERLGCHVLVAEDGNQAVTMAQLHHFDAILMDCQMPGLDGFEATRLIRRLEAESGSRAVPIVALTANAFVQDRARCIEIGMTDFLSKPFTAGSLRQILAKRLHNEAGA